MPGRGSDVSPPNNEDPGSQASDALLAGNFSHVEEPSMFCVTSGGRLVQACAPGFTPCADFALHPRLEQFTAVSLTTCQILGEALKLAWSGYPQSEHKQNDIICFKFKSMQNKTIHCL